MQGSDRIVVVIGGSGFVGTHTVKALADAGYRVRVLVRDKEAAAHLKPYGDVGQITVISGNVLDPASVRPALAGAYGVVYLPGLLFQRGAQNFRDIHAIAAGQVAQLSAEAGAQRFLFFSALGVERADASQYASTKYEGEHKVREAREDAIIFRPSVIFGADDDFLLRFAKMAQFSPFLPLVGGGKTLFQPVSVEDVAQAAVQAMACPKALGKTFSLCGPETLSFKEILRRLLATTGQRACLLPLPTFAAKILGSVLGAFHPAPPLTRDQVVLLGYDNVATADALGLAALGITPRSLSQALPFILRHFRVNKANDLPITAAE